MESLSSSIISTSPFPSLRPIGVPLLPNKPRTVRFRTAASKRDTYGWDYGGGLVDENMIVLRKRIHDMEIAERNYEPPSDWMEWEKRYYTTYGSDVCEFVGIIQTLLINARPSFAVGLVVLMAVSVPTSAVLISVHLMEAVRVGLLGMNLG